MSKTMAKVVIVVSMMAAASSHSRTPDTRGGSAAFVPVRVHSSKVASLGGSVSDGVRMKVPPRMSVPPTRTPFFEPLDNKYQTDDVIIYSGYESEGYGSDEEDDASKSVAQEKDCPCSDIGVPIRGGPLTDMCDIGDVVLVVLPLDRRPNDGTSLAVGVVEGPYTVAVLRKPDDGFSKWVRDSSVRDPVRCGGSSVFKVIQKAKREARFAHSRTPAHTHARTYTSMRRIERCQRQRGMLGPWRP